MGPTLLARDPGYIPTQSISASIKNLNCAISDAATGGGISQQFRKPFYQAFLPRSVARVRDHRTGAEVGHDPGHHSMRALISRARK
jgi:hypothetical protein